MIPPPSLAREHNDANVAAVGARQHSNAEVLELIKAFIAEPFSNDERHVRRIGKIASFEQPARLSTSPCLRVTAFIAQPSSFKSCFCINPRLSHLTTGQVHRCRLDLRPAARQKAKLGESSCCCTSNPQRFVSTWAFMGSGISRFDDAPPEPYGQVRARFL
jgi:hypothetical protein